MATIVLRRAALALSAAALLAGGAAAQGGPAARPGAAGRERVALRVGEMAPDFALPRLDPFLATNAPATAQKIESVRLSALRGKRPVVLILSSFT